LIKNKYFLYILSFDLLLIFYFVIPFSSREADGIPKMFSYEFLLVPAGL